jgi:hypothetical protein
MIDTKKRTTNPRRKEAFYSMTLPASNCSNNNVLVKRRYPFEEYIINTQHDTETASELVSWQFSNGHIVQLIFFTDGKAELFSLSPAIILPEEGENGIFYISREIELFLSKVQQADAC